MIILVRYLYVSDDVCKDCRACSLQGLEVVVHRGFVLIGSDRRFAVGKNERGSFFGVFRIIAGIAIY